MKQSPTQQEFIFAHENEDVRELALRFRGEDMPFLLAQIAGRQMAKYKIPTWYRTGEIVYPVHLSLEQASSEMMARYKCTLLPDKRERFADLTGGMGVDYSFMAPSFRHALYLEQDEELCRIAIHNFELLGLNHATVLHGKSEDYLSQMEKADLIYLDPSRRDEAGRKVFRMEDCSPDLTQLKVQLLEKADRVMIKYSPMLDISLAVKTVGDVSEVHVVSVENECKELLFILTKDAGECRYHAVNLHRGGEMEVFLFTREEETQEAVLTSQPERYLYEPNASIMKTGAFNAVGNSYQLMKLHRHSHLYTSDLLLPGFPGRIFTIEEVMVPNRINVRRFVSETEKVNIAVRNYPMSVAEIRRKTGLKDGGERYLFATTLADGQKVWIVGKKVKK
ncbi:MAG: SAM-dependent methyltransferase [Bacteroidales bacterium]|jgi:16S rRNA G966 N2-methylase RsmD|nr:SAM-dependent methyltransferase [Bacteroidales bacterium]